MFLNMMQDWAGWLLMLFNFSIVLMFKRVRSDTKVIYAIWFCMVLHHVVAYYHVYIPDASKLFYYLYIPDAASFHGDGAYLAALPEPKRLSVFTNGAINFTHSLGFVYRAFSSSFLFGKELSVSAFTLSCVVLVKLVDHLDLRRFCVGIILIFGLMPSAIVFRSATLREPWQALFFLLFVYWAIRLRKRTSMLILLFMLMSAFCMAYLHHGLARYAIYLVVFGIYWGIFSRQVRNRFTPLIINLLLAGLLIACVIISSQKMGLLMSPGEGLEKGADMRQTLLKYKEVRTNFSFILDTSSVFGIVTTFPMVFAEYMFAPFPWQVECSKDIYAMLESILRFVLSFFALFSWRRSSSEARSCCRFLFIVVLGMEFMWALGTANWGTAVRHHVPGYSIVALLGAPGLIQFIRKLDFKMFGRGKVSGEFNEQVRHMS